MNIIDVTDLPQTIRDAVDADTLGLLVAGLNAKALRVAPCLAAEDVEQGVIDEARLILLGTVKRWAESGSGAYSQQTAGPFSVSVDTRQRGGGYSMWPSEEDALRNLCGDSADRSVFTVDTAPAGYGVHALTCSLRFGALYCSCGADLTNYQYPLYGA